MRTQQEIERLIESHQELEEHVNSYLYRLSGLGFIDAPSECDGCEVNYDLTYIYFKWTTEEGCRGCYETVYHDYMMPVEYLSRDVDEVIQTLKDEHKREQDELARVRQERNAKQAAEKAAEQEAKDYQKYLELKEKYDAN